MLLISFLEHYIFRQRNAHINIFSCSRFSILQEYLQCELFFLLQDTALVRRRSYIIDDLQERWLKLSRVHLHSKCFSAKSMRFTDLDIQICTGIYCHIRSTYGYVNLLYLISHDFGYDNISKLKTFDLLGCSYFRNAIDCRSCTGIFNLKVNKTSFIRIYGIITIGVNKLYRIRNDSQNRRIGSVKSVGKVITLTDP